MLAMAVTEQGQDVQVVCQLEPRRPFDGEAKLELFGLPNKVTTEPAKITKDTKEVVFKVKTDAKSPVGRHKSLFCRLSLVKHGETMLQSLAGGGTLRIDKPRPAPKAKAKKSDEKAKKSEPKRLTRLEQLRLEQEKRRAEARKK